MAAADSAADSQVRLRQHDLAMQCLESPAAVDEPLRQPIEQFGMTGRLAEMAKIAGRGH